MAEEIDYEALPSNAGLGVNMLAGAMAGISEHAVMFPVDSIKTRMQVITTSNVAVYSSLGNAVQRIASTEGLRTLWRGVASVIMGAGPAHAVQFGTYEAVKEFAGDNRPGHFIKQRMQLKDSAFRSVASCARTVYRNEGLTAFYISYPTTLTMSVPFAAAQFTAYESIKRVLNPSDRYSPITHVTAGGMAGAFAAAITTPLDVAKTLLQTRGTSEDPRIRHAQGMRDAFQIIYDRNGLKGFTRGLAPRVLTFMPSNALCWLCYEFFRIWVAGRLAVTPNIQPENPNISNQLFPNAASLPPQGQATLREFSFEGAPTPPSQVTFVFSALKDTLRGALPVISRLQLMGFRIHLLVPSSQAIELEYLLDTLLPATHNISVYHTIPDDTGAALNILHHAKYVETPWVWIMPSNIENVVQSVETWVDSVASKVPRVQVPTGTYGARLTDSGIACISTRGRVEPVAFLVPPFLAPTPLLVESEPGISADIQANVWASLGERIARITGSGMGGVVVGSAYNFSDRCKSPSMTGPQGILAPSEQMVDTLRDHFRSTASGKIQFALFLPSQTSLKRIAPTVCRILQNGHDLATVIRELGNADSVRSNGQQQSNYGCHIHYTGGEDTGSGYDKDIIALTESWCGTVMKDKILIIGGDEGLKFGRIPKSRVCATAVIYLRDSDLESSEWLSMLTPEEWRAWDIPAIELAVITHDRPWSLRRLLNSVKQGHYYGDTISVVINLEQTADLETRQIAEEFTMGDIPSHVSVRHRIVYAGLMTAVVESWYPHGNNSYGVILEDDVELSPLFYAWIKFSVLRYRYGTPSKDTHQLYGISLYQPKVSELHMQGRRPFNASNIFVATSVGHPHTPYLSQVPCSWGAVYFPEHWREFQQYLSLRLSEHLMLTTDIVVPNLRSNKWSRSWKKFFNEMVYLRGYASLYPNYDHFVSLSTNHLEAGEHVPMNINQEKQRQYFLPLMQEPEVANLHPGTELGVKLLDLPLSNLPSWTDLPVLDLWGNISSLESLQSIGLNRRKSMSVCQPDEIQAIALEYLCPPRESVRSENSLGVSYVSSNEDDIDLMQG
ncbi:putative mitochondrial carrier C8C9,12c [Rhizoctonia solani AG-1 IB]|uniref:Putative mitochondrial carrier C8C9,12c n=1 Tax=Thanatephorus cucumeris (strain AG1-IB / isolate 7/3/14) TaxID=1108050 RepID=M5BN43_THACB|nr:putative mitochondrial carrier C8C9,12c [Rhizoctonia solani AG-1 IB]